MTQFWLILSAYILVGFCSSVVFFKYAIMDERDPRLDGSEKEFTLTDLMMIILMTAGAPISLFFALLFCGDKIVLWRKKDE